MNKSKVYYTNLRTDYKNNLLDKLKSLVIKAGINNIDFKDLTLSKKECSFCCRL